MLGQWEMRRISRLPPAAFSRDSSPASRQPLGIRGQGVARTHILLWKGSPHTSGSAAQEHPPTHHGGLTGCSGHTPPCSPSCCAAEASGSAASANGPACTTEPALPGTAKREGSPGDEGSEPGWLEVDHLQGRRPHENILESQARAGVL